MIISEESKEKIYSFFNENQVLAECFLQLFEYQKLSVNDVDLEFREGLIGFKREGERLRLYVVKDKKGIYRIKIKTATSHIFMPAEMINYQSDIDKNNQLFNEKKDIIKIKTQDLNKKSNNNVKTNNVVPTIKRTANNRGVQRFMIKSMSVNDIQPILDCINEFKRDGIKRIRVRITEEEI